MENLRKVKGKYWSKEACNYIEFSMGYFHCRGASYEEFENGPGNYTVGIVELIDGKIIEVLPNNLMFQDV